MVDVPSPEGNDRDELSVERKIVRSQEPRQDHFFTVSFAKNHNPREVQFRIGPDRLLHVLVGLVRRLRQRQSRDSGKSSMICWRWMTKRRPTRHRRCRSRRPVGSVNDPFDIVILGLSITSSWGNGHATTYRSLVRGLAGRGHRVLFLERNQPWYEGNRDQPQPEGAVTQLYESAGEAMERFEKDVRRAKLVILGSFVQDGTLLADWITSAARGRTAFYDIDTPVTLARLKSGDAEYISAALIPRFSLYLSFTGGPALRALELEYGAQMARPFYCSADPEIYHPVAVDCKWDMGYLGTYSPDRQPGLNRLLIEPARRWPEGRFSVAGAMFPEDIKWPANVGREIHLSPHQHAAFYAAQRFTLNITRDEMKKLGYSPSVRLFEAGACGSPLISDSWDGLDRFFQSAKRFWLRKVQRTAFVICATCRIPGEKRSGARRWCGF